MRNFHLRRLCLSIESSDREIDATTELVTDDSRFYYGIEPSESLVDASGAFFARRFDALPNSAISDIGLELSKFNLIVSSTGPGAVVLAAVVIDLNVRFFPAVSINWHPDKNSRNFVYYFEG